MIAVRVYFVKSLNFNFHIKPVEDTGLLSVRRYKDGDYLICCTNIIKK